MQVRESLWASEEIVGECSEVEKYFGPFGVWVFFKEANRGDYCDSNKIGDPDASRSLK